MAYTAFLSFLIHVVTLWQQITFLSMLPCPVLCRASASNEGEQVTEDSGWQDDNNAECSLFLCKDKPNNELEAGNFYFNHSLEEYVLVL